MLRQLRQLLLLGARSPSYDTHWHENTLMSLAAGLMEAGKVFIYEDLAGALDTALESMVGLPKKGRVLATDDCVHVADGIVSCRFEQT